MVTRSLCAMVLVAAGTGGAPAQQVELRLLARESVASVGAEIDTKRIALAMGRSGLAVREAADTATWLTPAEDDTKTVVLYYAGDLARDAQGTPRINDLRLDEIWARFGARRVVLAIEDCFARDGLPSTLAEMTMPPVSGPRTLLATAGPDGVCDADLRRLTDRIATGDPGPGGEIWHLGGDAGPADLGVWSAVIRGAQITEQGPDPGADYSLVRYDPNTPVPIFDWTTTGVRLPSGVGALDPVLVRQSWPDPVLRAPGPGRPQPSVLIGRLPDQVGGAEATDLYRDRTAREALRQADFETFVLLLSAGALDPPTDPDQARAELLIWDRAYFAPRLSNPTFDPVVALRALALQDALQRMGCYTSRLDGDWGPGSVRAAAAYAAQTVDALATEALAEEGPSLVLWRAVISQDPVVCRSEPAARISRAPARANPVDPQPRRPTASRPAAPAPAPAPVPAAPVIIPFN